MKYATALLLGSAHAIDKTEIEQIALGFFEGALQEEKLDDYVTCTVVDGEKVEADVKAAIAALESKSIKGVTDGLNDMADAFSTITAAYRLCTSGADAAKVQKLEDMLKTFKNPLTFVVDVAKHIEVNGKDITEHMVNGGKEFSSGDYQAFGKDFGEALAEVVFGQMTMELHETKLTEAVEIIEGILWGAVKAEGLDNIRDCVIGAEAIVDDVKVAITDFEEETASSVLDGLKHLGKATFEIKNEISTCEGVVADFEKLEKMATIFASPWSFAYHVGKDLVVNGVEIFHDVEDSITEYKGAQYEKFGEDVGDALAKLILGGAWEMQEKYDQEAAEGLNLF